MALLAFGGAAALFAAYVALTGGIDTHLVGIPLRSRSWERPAMLAAILAAAGLTGLRRQIAAGVPWLASRGRRSVQLLVLLAAGSTGIVGLAFGTYAAGGSDSSGYLSQAQLMAAGRLTDTHPVHPAFRWPDAAATFAPLGYRAGRTDGVIVPTYPPGLPLLMTPLAMIDARAVFLLVPLTAIVAVWLCWRLGLALGEPLAGALGACLLAASPTFLYHAVQPMSDIPATAFWTGALVLARRPDRRGSAAAGLAASVAILIRPNLAPLAVFVVAAAATAGASGARARARWCAAWMVPGGAILGTIQAIRYGSPFSSGYGALSDLFLVSNVVPNVGRYGGWLTETQTPFIWIWLLAPVWIAVAAPAVQRFAWLCWGFALAVFAAYLPYGVFNPEEWFYTRFLLPAFPSMLVLGMAVILTLARRALRQYAALAAVLLTAALAAAGIAHSISAGVFDLHLAERRYRAVGAFVEYELPLTAAIIADQHSGSVRYYSGRPTLRWQVLDPGSLDTAVTGLWDAGYEPYLVLDPHEESVFRERFGRSSAPLLDRLAPVATIERTGLYVFRRPGH